DYTPAGGVHHLMGRVASSRVERPQFIWSPYQGFGSPLVQNTLSLMAALTSNLGPRRVNEARVSWSDDDLSWDRAHPEIATLATVGGVLLPGSLSAYAYKNHSRTFEFTDQFVWSDGPHLVKLGGGALLRNVDGYLTYGGDGYFLFNSMQQFASSQPDSFSASVDRTALPNLQIPSFDRQYTYNQFHLFAQDTYRVTPRLTLNYGLRYENFGAPQGTGAVKDLLLQPGAAGAEITGAQLAPEAAGQPIYGRDNRGWAARLGASYALTANGRTLLHGGSGLFYDHPYDNLWRNVSNNSFSLDQFSITAASTNYLAPAAQALPEFANQTMAFTTNCASRQCFPQVTWIDANLRNPYIWSSFLGVQQELARRVTLEVNGLETLGRRLISTDVLNRDSSTNESLPAISYIANQGSSNYSALTALLRYHTSSMQFQAAYTWSHSIDNQSSPLAGDFFNLAFAGLSVSTVPPPQAAFSIAGDLRADRGNSDFDQRQNLVLMWTGAIPNPRGSSRAWAPLRDWQFSGLTAFRTGFPYSVYASAGYTGVINRRGNLVNQSQEFTDQPAPGFGGRLLLSPPAFVNPSKSTPLGNLGRNDITGPGLYNADVSVSRSIAVRKLGEAGRIELRADLFNALNHANLGNPDSTIGDPDFGVALYGRKPEQTGFPGLIPLTENARQIQLMVRVKW
ncbi:MAG: TonB-dependent receptor, partial [Bryobacteraceae bacterium]